MPKGATRGVWLFGSWEMKLGRVQHCARRRDFPKSKRGSLGFFMYPQGETATGRLDSLDPDSFQYEITAR